MKAELGKIEDAGRLVEGGGIDRYWSREEITIDPSYYTGSSTLFKAQWLYDPEVALQHFGLRSIEFGNWMNQEDRANFLYASMLGLHQLALIFGVKDNQIGLGGKLSIALGARGTGGAAGHYESIPFSVINITKPHGRRGVLAHEYAHALDNIISFYTKSKQTFVSGGRTTRKGFDEGIAQNGNYFEQQFEEFFNLLYYDESGEKTDFHHALNRKDEYWNRRNEVFARTFEVYISDKQKKRKHPNTFLAPTAFSKAYPSLELIEGGISRIIGNIVNKGFSVMTAQDPRLNGLQLPNIGYKGFRRTLKENAKLDDTLENMKRIAIRDTYQVQELAKDLEGSTVEETAQNIWNFIRENISYKLDTEGIEELRTPSRTLNDGIFDCDDATILVSALLLNLGIDHEYRIASYKEKGKFSHIYPVAFDAAGNQYVIDTVPEIPHFNYEEKPIIDLKTVNMELHELSGITNEVSQSEAKQDILKELNQPFSLSGFEDEDIDDDILLESSFLSGLGEVDSEEEADIVISTKEDALQLVENGILAEVHKAKESLLKEQQNPTILSQTINVKRELNFLNKLMQAWDDENMRVEQINNAIAQNSAYKNFFLSIRMSLEELENESENLSGIEDDEPIYLARLENMDLAELLEGEEDGLSGRRELRGFFKKLGKKISGTVKKVGNTVKKVAKAVVRYNPATIAVRNATLLVLKLNLFNISSKIIYAYLTREQAIAKNMDLGEWSKVVNAKNQLEKFFTKIGGKSHNFRNAIIKGKAAQKTGVRLNGLGEVATASTAAASGFIVFAKKLLSAINPVKLFKKVAANIKEKKAAKQASLSTENTNMNSMDFNSNDFGNEALDFSEAENAANQGDGNSGENGNTTKTGFLQKVKNIWNSHKKKVIAGGLTVLSILIFLLFWKSRSKKKKNQLRGIKAARTRARNRKTQLKGLPAPKASTSKIRRRKTKSLGRGNTTVVKTPSKGRGKTRVYKQSSKSRLSLMHAKAKQLQKKHPKTKYSKLLSMAAKQI